MWRVQTAVCGLIVGLVLRAVPAQSVAANGQQATGAESTAPMPDIASLLADVERNQKQLEALQRDYTYHVHTERQELDKNGKLKKSETEDAESLTISGVRVDKVTARDGVPLTPEEQQKESERIDKVVAKAREREAKLQAKGELTDQQGNEVMPLSRILELGSFSNPRRLEEGGRSLVVVDYAGNPAAKTHSAFEAIMRDVVGTIAIDEQDRVLVRAEGHFLNDFKLGGGLVADVRKGTTFGFRATRVADKVWLPATIDGQGGVRILLFVHFYGRLHLVASDYRRFRAKATIVGSHGAIGPDGQPLPDQSAPDQPVPGTTGATGVVPAAPHL